MNHLNLGDLGDSTAELNKKINESMVMMDSNDNSNPVHEKKVRKSISLNLEAQPPTPTSKYLKPNQTPKGILKKKEKNDVPETEKDDYRKIEAKSSMPEPRPHNLEEFVNIEGLIPTSIDNTFSLEDLSDDDEIWLMNMPKKINPELLSGQVLSFTNKTNLKVGNERYTAIHREAKGYLTCVFSTSNDTKSNKIVNLKPAGLIQLRQKLTVTPKIKPECTKKEKVPLPQNIRPRDPFVLGVVRDKIVHTNGTNVKTENELGSET